MGRIRPISVGWANPGQNPLAGLKPSPTQLVIVHKHSNQLLPRLQGRAQCTSCMAREETKATKKGGSVYLDRRRRLQLLVAAEAETVPAMAVAASPPVFSSSVQRRERLCFYLFLFFFFSLSRSPFSLLSRPPFSFSVCFPCFYRQKQGKDVTVGRPLLAAPSTTFNG